MSVVQNLLKNNRDEELWQLCCGFLDLSLEQFMNIQRSLLLEQLAQLKSCSLGQKLLRGAQPLTVEEFRRQVPLTTYVDYCPELLEKREDVLPAPPAHWIQTSGKSGEYPFKWVPVSQRFWEEAGLNFSAIALLGSCHRKGEVVLKRKMKLLHAAAQPPFLTSAIAHRLEEDIDFDFLPNLNEAEQMDFEERVESGFKMALSDGMDGFYGLAGVLVAIGKRFQTGSSRTSKASLLSQPKALLRLTNGILKSKRARRALMPKDLWNLKVITSMGTDSLVFKDKIEELWGRKPLNVYGTTETTVVATQTWDYKDMVFFPNLNFLEFIPEDECRLAKIDKFHKPKTILLDEVQPGKIYELVITSFHSGIMVRYRTGDLIRITALSNDALGIKLPQMMLEGRADDLIDLGFMRLNERVIWQALEHTCIPYRDWTAHKEKGESPKLHIYLELANGYYTSSEEVAARLYEAIKKLDDGLYVYKEIASIENLIDFKPIEVTLLREGTFSSYKRFRKAENAALIDLKPPHVNPSKEELSLLGAVLNSSGELAETTA
jgi:hypothetical protein